MDKIINNFKILANNFAAECESEHSPELYKALLSTLDVIDSPEFNSKSPRFRKFLGNALIEQSIQALFASNNKIIVDNAVTVLGDICTRYYLDEDLVHILLNMLNLKLFMLTLEDDSTIGKIYRLLGNVYRKRYLRKEITVVQEKTIIKHIACTLKAVAYGTSDVTSKATIIMGIRCIREFLKSNTLMMLVTEFEVLKTLGLMLIKYSKTWNQNHDHKNILYNVIKVLYKYSKFDYPYLLIELKNIEQGNSLLCLSDVLLISPKHTINIVMNILRMSWLKSELPIPEICEELVKFLTNGTFMLETEYEEYIQCICYLFEHPANRNSSNWGRNIPFLINTLKHFREVSDSNLKCSFLIISTLNKYVDNRMLIHKQLSNGIIEVLTKKLEWIFNSSEFYDLKFQVRKQNDDVLKAMNLLRTDIPSFCDSFILSSYSPKYDYKLFASSEQETKLSLLLEEIIHVIRKCLQLIPEHPRLASSDLLIALLKCYYFNRSIMSLKLMFQILYTSSHLIPLILDDFVPKLLELTRCQHSDNRSKCDELRKMRNTILTNLTIYAESSVGVRDIEFKLLHANKDVKVKLIIAIPYIIETKSLLVKFMIDCRGLEILLEICQNQLKSRGIKVLCKLVAKKLGIANPKKVSGEPMRYINIYSGNYRLRKLKAYVVTFKLDDGSSVPADREFLSSKSDYFNILLNGSFRECKEHEIRLPDIGNKTLKILLSLLKYDFDSTVEELLSTNLDLETLLDVTRQCDKFLLNEVGVVLTKSIVELKLSPVTVSRIYQWSIESCTNLLRAEAVAYALVANVADEQRFTMFNNLFSLGYSEVLVEDIKKLMEGYLKPELRVVHQLEQCKIARKCSRK